LFNKVKNLFILQIYITNKLFEIGYFSERSRLKIFSS